MLYFNKIVQLIIAHQHSVIFIPLISTLAIIILLFYRFVFPKKIISPLILVILISIPPILNLFKPGTFQGGDLSNHTEYLRAFYQNLSYGILIPRWAADFCAGNG